MTSCPPSSDCTCISSISDAAATIVFPRYQTLRLLFIMQYSACFPVCQDTPRYPLLEDGSTHFGKPMVTPIPLPLYIAYTSYNGMFKNNPTHLFFWRIGFISFKSTTTNTCTCTTMHFGVCFMQCYCFLISCVVLHLVPHACARHMYVYGYVKWESIGEAVLGRGGACTALGSSLPC